MFIMPSLTSLAEQLLVKAREIDGLLEQNGIPYPSFEVDTLELLPSHTQKLRRELTNTSYAFQQLVRGARNSGMDVAFNWTEQLVLRIVWQYNLASIIPTNGSATYDEISAASGLDRSLVVRTLRAAISLNIFREEGTETICHSAISRLLAEDHGYNSVIGLQVADWAPASSRLIEAWDKFGPTAGEPEHSAFSLANGGQSLFTVLSQDTGRATRFNSAMKYSVENTDFESYDIINAFDWPSLDKPGSRIVDLGGGYGQVSQILAEGTQHLSFTVQDLPHVTQEGRNNLPSGLGARISFLEQSFLEDQPAKDPPNAFLISRCLHNWSDHHTSLILRALIPALRKGSKILIWDNVLADKPSKDLSERLSWQQDFIMATISNGKDRTAAEFMQVLDASDKRFKVETVTRSGKCKLSMIEVTWRDQD